MTVVAETSNRDGRRGERSDARRNRERLLLEARAMFAEGMGAFSLDALARRAGVGIGTVYRHFPDRTALMEAVYRQAIAALAEAGERLHATAAPLDALRDWMGLFIDYVATKRLIAPALKAAAGDDCPVFAEGGRTVGAVMERLVARAVAAGEIRADTRPSDLLRAIAGLAFISDDPGWTDSARRLVDILLAGSRPG